MEANISDTLASCRLCKKSEQDLHTIYPFVGVLADLMDIDITVEDGQSKLVCDVCTEKITNWCDFKMNCQGNQPVIQGWTKESTSEVNLQVKEEYIEIVDDIITMKTEPTEFESGEDDSTNSLTDAENPEDIHPDQQFENPHENHAQESADVPEDVSNGKISSKKNPDMESLSPLENSFIEKCKSMVDMYRSLKCACHSTTHRDLRGLLRHLRSMNIGFPSFTCYHCMITFTDRSSSTKHFHKCPNKDLDTLVKLSNLMTRSTLKTRIYQNYRCVECKFRYSFHEDFCKHIDEEHSDKISPYICSCQQVFASLEDLKKHMYAFCMIEYYCEICNISVATSQEFINHSQDQHDGCKGFALVQDDNYKKRSFHNDDIRESRKISGKRRCSNHGRALNSDQMGNDDTPSINQSKCSKRIPTKCLQCNKVYSSRTNMLRHSRTHEGVEKEILESSESTETHRHSQESLKCEKVMKNLPIIATHSGLSTGLSSETSVNSSESDISMEGIKSKESEHKECEDYITCEKCYKVFSHKVHLKKHMEMHRSNMNNPRVSESPKKLSHGRYDSRFENSEALNNQIHEEYEEKPDRIHHKRRQHSQQSEPLVSSFKCKRCNISFSSQRAMRAHVGWHKRTNNKRSSTPSVKKAIVQPELSNEKFRCCTCGMAFPNDVALKIHTIEKHGNATALRTPRCETCKLQFEDQTAFDNHQKLHDIVENQKPNFSCQFCPTLFAQAVTLQVHIKLSHPTMRQYDSQQASLTNDDKVHVKQKAVVRSSKLFNCSICKVAFNEPKDLRTHTIEAHPF